MNIAILLEMATEAAPDRLALICDNRRWTYRDLLFAAQGAARLITQCKAEFVALLDEGSEAAVIALFGAAIAGVPYCPLNYRLPDVDLAGLLRRISPACVVGDADRVRRIGGDCTSVIFERTEFVEQAAKPCPTAGSPFDGVEEEVAVQLFTSGTTAAPKAAILRHANLLGYILGSVEFASADESERSLVVVPPYHIAGISAIMSSIYAGRCMVMLPSFTPDRWLDLVAAEKVSNAFVVPTMLQRIVEARAQGTGHDVTSLASIAYGGGKMPLEVIQRALQLFPDVGFTNAYGLTETSSTIALLTPNDHREAMGSSDPMIRARLVSIGQALPAVEIEIRDDEGRTVPAGQSGEIYVRGPQVSGEYRGRSALIDGGWFPTRDAGYIDKDGYIFLSGRADDVIVRGGENMSPGEIEDVLVAHTAIADAAAVGIPSLEWGETVGVAVVVKQGQTASDVELQEWVRQRLRSSRVPERIIRLETLPYNEMGKLLRREVRTLFSL